MTTNRGITRHANAIANTSMVWPMSNLVGVTSHLHPLSR